MDDAGNVLPEWQGMVEQRGMKAVATMLGKWRAWVEQHGIEAVRCRQLVPSIPAKNETPTIPREGNTSTPSTRLDDLREQVEIIEVAGV